MTILSAIKSVGAVNPRLYVHNFSAMDARDFIDAHIEAALFTSTDDDDKPMEDNYASDSIHPDSLVSMVADCVSFIVDNREWIRGNHEQAGHDFWLTRNGHGAGFWDGDWPENDGAILEAASKEFGESNLYIGDDGLIHVFSG